MNSLDYFNGYKLGSKVSKNMHDTSHHDGYMNYYRIPQDQYERLKITIIHNHGINKPATFNEHSPPDVCRMFLDLDCNKVVGQPLFCEGALLNSIKEIQNGLSKKLRNKIPSNEVIEPQLKSSRQVFSWYESPREDDERAELDFMTLFVLRSKVHSTGGYTYHLIWPFQVMRRDHMVNIFTSIFPAFDDFNESINYSSCPDFQCVSNGSLRGYLCDKLDSNKRPEKRPFEFYKAYDGSGNELFREFTEPQIWAATSILFVRRDGNANPVVIPESQIMVNGEEATYEEYMANASKRFHENPTDLGYNPAKMYKLLSEKCELAVNAIGINVTSYEIEEYIMSDIVEYLNTVFARIVYMSSNIFLVKHYNREDKMVEYSMKPVRDIKACFSPGSTYKLTVNNRSMIINAFDILFDSINALVFHRTTFCDPDDRYTEYFNLWRGYSYTKQMCIFARNHSVNGIITKKEFNVKSIIDHIHSFICGGDPNSTTYLLGWLAHILQFPFKKTNTTPVLISQEGIGKDVIFTQIMGSIIGNNHFVNTSSSLDIIGKFNGMLEGKTLVIFNEVHSVEERTCSVLKSLITEDMMRVERKFINAYMVQNKLNIVICSNNTNSQVIHVSSNSRRYFFLKCDSSIAGNLDYFNDFVTSLHDDNDKLIKAFADYLYNMDLSKFDVRNVPITEELVNQKVNSMPDVHDWWYNCVNERIIYHQGTEYIMDDNVKIVMLKSALFESYKLSTGNLKRTNSDFWKLLKKVCVITEHKPHGGSRLVTIPLLCSCVSSIQDYYKGLLSNRENIERIDSSIVKMPNWDHSFNGDILDFVKKFKQPILPNIEDVPETSFDYFAGDREVPEPEKIPEPEDEPPAKRQKSQVNEESQEIDPFEGTCQSQALEFLLG